MPIYAYRCASCGHAQDVLQKMSDPLLSVCPACGAATYEKQVTAAGFQLKGSGWYVTDFRGGNTGASKEAKSDDKGDATPAAADTGATPAAEKAAEKAAAPAAAPAPAADA
jgi:putative FmdB family regulatory protein